MKAGLPKIDLLRTRRLKSPADHLWSGRPVARRRLPVLVLTLLLVLPGLFVPGRPAGAAACLMTEDVNGDVIIAVSCDLAANTYNVTRDFIVNSGVTVTAKSSGGSGVMINAGRDITIIGILTASAQGYGSEAGPGPGNNAVDVNSGSGAGHGGNGGQGSTNTGGTTYGSVAQPLSVGSGGGGDANDCAGAGGGAGGGAIKLAAAGTLTFSGTLSANGQTATCSDAGGGSGGSLWLDAPTITGGGAIAADGGSGRSAECGGGAGGGRIAFY